MATVAKGLLPAVLQRLSRKHKAGVSVIPAGGSVRTFGTWWDGGSKAVYALVNWRTGEKRPVNAPTSPFGPTGVDVTPEPGWAVFEGGTSCGKEATPHYYVREDDAPAFAALPVARLALEGAPLSAPLPVLSDWLKDRGRDADADRLQTMFPDRGY
jgi:hypothetical protein